MLKHSLVLLSWSLVLYLLQQQFAFFQPVASH